MPLIAKIAVSAATYAIDKPYDYLLPEELGAAVGCRVLVPFGRGNRTSEGVVLSVSSGVPEKPLKAVRQKLDDEPVLLPGQIKLALWMRQRYFCSIIFCFFESSGSLSTYFLNMSGRLSFVRASACSQRQRSISPWFPESSISGTSSPSYSRGFEYCGYSRSPE